MAPDEDASPADDAARAPRDAAGPGPDPTGRGPAEAWRGRWARRWVVTRQRLERLPEPWLATLIVVAVPVLAIGVAAAILIADFVLRAVGVGLAIVAALVAAAAGGWMVWRRRHRPRSKQEHAGDAGPRDAGGASDPESADTSQSDAAPEPDPEPNPDADAGRKRLLDRVAHGPLAPTMDPGDLVLQPREALWSRCIAYRVEPDAPADAPLDPVEGDLGVTTTRLLFAARRRSIAIPFDAVTAVRVEPEGVTLLTTTADAAVTFHTGDNELVAAYVRRAIREWTRGSTPGRAGHPPDDGQGGAAPDQPEAVDGYVPELVKAVVWQRDQGRCVRCGATDDLSLVMVTPRHRGGTAVAENLEVCCGRCLSRDAAHVGA